MALPPDRLKALTTLVDLYKATLPALPVTVPLDLPHLSPRELRTTLKLLRALLRSHATGRHLVHRPPVAQALQAIRALLAHHANHLND